MAGVRRSPVNARDLQLECASVFHETFLVPVFMYGSRTMLLREKKRSRIMAVWRIERMLNTRVIVICDMKKGISERIDEIVLRWFGIVKMVHEKGVYGRPSCELTGKEGY